MIIRLLLYIVLFIVIARVFWKFVDNVIEAAGGQTASSRKRVPDAGVRMMRDPVCGMFVVPDRALTLADGRTTHYFCSAGCRDKFKRESVEGRTA
jgi:YHS domain-containing protein